VKIAAFIFSGLILLGYSCKNQSGGKPPAIYVKNVNPDLVKSDQGWQYKGKPFSGYMVEAETNGKIVYQLPIIQGKENGKAIGFYNSGEKLLECMYVDGQKQGLYQHWWPNGNLRYLFSFQNGKYQGKQLVYFPNGKIREESNYQLGEKEGTQRVWSETCKLISNYVIKNKRIYGVVSVKSCIPVDGH
jgi:antitoxin component YwqK of YwqJK toxin-antitoxin module